MKFCRITIATATTMFLSSTACLAEEVKELTIDAEVLKTGDMAVEEVIVVNLGLDKPKHGIERSLPTKFAKNKATVKLEQIANAFGNVPYTETNTADQKRIRIGDPNRLVHGTNIYKIQYLLLGAGTPSAKGLETTWSPNGKNWKIPIRMMKVVIRAQEGTNVVVSKPVPRGQSKTVKGETHIVVKELAPGEAISLTITAPVAVALTSTATLAAHLGRDEKLLQIGLAVLGVGGLGFAAWRVKNRCRCNCGASCRCSCGCGSGCECVALSRSGSRAATAGSTYFGYDDPYYGTDYHGYHRDTGSSSSFDSGAGSIDFGGSSDSGAGSDFGDAGDSGGGGTW